MLGSGRHRRCQLPLLAILLMLAFAGTAHAAEPWQWGSPQLLLDPPTAGDAVAPASETASMDAQGNLTAAWLDGTGLVNTLSTGPGGAAPSAPVPLGGAGSVGARVASIANGDAVAAWVGSSGDIFVSFRAGGTWGAPKMAYHGAGSATVHALDVAADASGKAILAWSENVHNVPGPGTHDQLRALRFTTATSVFATPDIVDATDPATGAPAVGFDSSQLATVLWSNDNAGAQTLFESHASTSTWSAASGIATAPAGDNVTYREPRLAVDPAGKLAAAWQIDPAAGSSEVDALTGVSGGPFLVADLGPTAGTADPTAAIDTTGIATVAWPQAAGIVTRSSVGGGAWGTKLTAIAAGVDVTQGAIAEGGTNAPAVVADPTKTHGRGVDAVFAQAPPPDTAAPTIAISAPTEGATYAQGTVLLASYTCADEPGGSGLASCVGDVASGAPVDTSSAGAKTFTVVAHDKAGNPATAVVHYTVTAPATPPPPAKHKPPTAAVGQLLARTPGGHTPNAPATDPAISHDLRTDRYVAYVSAATDIVPGSGANRNVFLVTRSKPWGINGTPWKIGATTLVSRGLGGAPANGDSWGPSLYGTDSPKFKSRCLAFVSAASNLVAGDTNGLADAFLLNLKNHKLKRFAGAGAVSEVSVDGKCTSFAYIANGTLYVKSFVTGATKRGSPMGGVSDLHMSADGKSVSFARGGFVYGGKVGHPTKIAAGANPTGDGFGRYVAFEQGGKVLTGNIKGNHNLQAIADGQDPSMTSGGHFVFYAQGPDVRVNVHKKAVASCPTGDAQMLAGSPHGNYVAYACTTGGLYLGYAGPQ